MRRGAYRSSRAVPLSTVVPTLIADEVATLKDVTILVSCPAGGTVTVVWGDGSSSSVTCDGALKTLTHTYGAAGRTYKIRIVGTIHLIREIRCLAQSWVSGDVASFAGLANALRLRLYSTSISGDLASLAGLTKLIYLSVYSTGINDYTSTPLPAWPNCDILINDLGLSSSEVDAFLIDLADGVGADGSLVYIAGNGARTSASDAAVAALGAAGWGGNI